MAGCLLDDKSLGTFHHFHCKTNSLVNPIGLAVVVFAYRRPTMPRQPRRKCLIISWLLAKKR
jgi:hypothetical protein